MAKVDPVEFAKAIADETRQKIMGICCCASYSVNEIVEKLNVSQPTVSHHLAILREAGLVETRSEGNILLQLGAQCRLGHVEQHAVLLGNDRDNGRARIEQRHLA